MDASTSSNGTSCSTSMNSPDNAASFVQRAAPEHGLLREMALLHTRFAQTTLAVILIAVPDKATTLPDTLQAWCDSALLTCDSLVAMGEGHFALLLPGAGVFKAQALAEQVLQSAPHSTLGMGIAAGGQECKEHPGTLLKQADAALNEALRTGQSVRVYREPQLALAHRKTLVRSDEKRFLFSGGN